MRAVELVNVNKKFGKKLLFKNVNFSIEKGETVGIIGGNGVGKSVLFKIICGIEMPTSGKVLIEGEELGKERDFPESMGIMINEPGFIGGISGFANLKELAIIQNKISQEQIKKTMELVGLDADDNLPVKKYSLGMKQKLGIAQAIMENQRIILLDESFNALDYKTCNEIKKIIKRLKSDGKTIIMTSHNQHDIDELCEHIYIIHNQELLELSEELKNKYFS